ncbi:MAG: glutamine--fructose-6-phosphate transaminase (isomerizing), partial [Bdellovibrionales bacterium]|nr:glutamine--fructose-6-phosphate transaminase (isomerizing) [Bdellovibrionales bacterium]
MCGIVGYIGPRSATPLLVAGLEKLEYRGYDSAGVATIENGGFVVNRAEGKLARLKQLLTEKGKLTAQAPNGALHVGMGHTRWATHGRPSETNAHPHVAGRVCVVHNGIIENYIELRERLQAEGCTFVSETDTEIAAHLINSHLTQSNDILEALRRAVAELVGSYALVVASLDEPNRLVIARNASPVIVGVAEGEMFVASDIPAVLEHTRNFQILEDGDIAELRVDGVTIEREGQVIQREPIHVHWDPITAEKGGYRHFMLKEIHEQPQVVTETFRGRIKQAEGGVFLDDVQFTDGELRGVERVIIVACGTAWHAALVTKFYIEKLARIPVEVDYGSEFRYRQPLANDKTLFMVISQSGETADTLGSLGLADELGAKTLAICNVVGSTIARRAKNVLYTHAGPEISVASTKAFSTQLTAGFLLAVRLGSARGVLSVEERDQLVEQLVHLPALITRALGSNRQIEKIAKKYGRSENFLYLGRGILYPIALEGALKLKEISYVHAEGYPA